MILTGNELKIKRIKHKIKQADLAVILNVSKIHLSRIENNKTSGLKYLLKATEYFNKLESEKE